MLSEEYILSELLCFDKHFLYGLLQLITVIAHIDELWLEDLVQTDLA